jgi:thiol-disulfide isomerase/thioredoxin
VLSCELNGFKNQYINACLNSFRQAFFLVIFFCSIVFAQKPKVGDQAPGFTSVSIEGSSFNLESVKGKIVLIDFWAPLCSPCLENNEELISVYQTYNSKGFEIVAIAIERDKEKILKIINKFKYPWKIQLWEVEEANAPVAITYDVETIPSSFLIDETGKIILINPDAYDLEKKLKKVFKGKE